MDRVGLECVGECVFRREEEECGSGVVVGRLCKGRYLFYFILQDNKIK